MGDEYTVKINRRDGGLEVVGPDKEWVDAKVDQLGAVLSGPLPAKQGSGRASGKSGASRKQPRQPASSSAENGADTAARRPRKATDRPTINNELRGQLTADI